jgi:hypothetical protein
MIAGDCWELLHDAASALRAGGDADGLDRAIRRFEGIGDPAARAVAALLEAVVEYADEKDGMIAELESDLEAALNEADEDD